MCINSIYYFIKYIDEVSIEHVTVFVICGGFITASSNMISVLKAEVLCTWNIRKSRSSALHTSDESTFIIKSWNDPFREVLRKQLLSSTNRISNEKNEAKMPITLHKFCFNSTAKFSATSFYKLYSKQFHCCGSSYISGASAKPSLIFLNTSRITSSNS